MDDNIKKIIENISIEDFKPEVLQKLLDNKKNELEEEYNDVASKNTDDYKEHMKTVSFIQKIADDSTNSLVLKLPVLINVFTFCGVPEDIARQYASKLVLIGYDNLIKNKEKLVEEQYQQTKDKDKYDYNLDSLGIAKRFAANPTQFIRLNKELIGKLMNFLGMNLAQAENITADTIHLAVYFLNQVPCDELINYAKNKKEKEEGKSL